MRMLVALLSLACVAAVAAGPAEPAGLQQDARALYARVVGFNTARGQGQVPAMANHLAQVLLKAGFPGEDIHILPLGETASLVARYRGDGTGGRPILLLAHMDVVPANAAEWERDPFTLVEENGYFFGRGTQDMKADIVAIVMAFVRLKGEGFVPRRDLVIVFTGDEETDQATTLDLIENHRDLIDAEFALNGDGWSGILDDGTGEPALYYLQGAEKSYATFEITAHNPGGHSSEPRADNAIYDLAAAMVALQGFRFPAQANEWTRASLAASGAVTPGALGDALVRFAANPDDAGAAEVLAAEPSYVGRTRTTCVATMLSAGHAENALPQTATATVNCRIFPGTTTASVRDVLQSVVGPGLDVKLAGLEFDAVASPLREDVIAAVERAVHTSRPGVRVVPDQSSYYSDSSFFRAAGIPAYGTNGLFLRPRDSFYHGLNERVPVASFYHGLTHWYELVRALAGSATAAD